MREKGGGNEGGEGEGEEGNEGCVAIVYRGLQQDSTRNCLLNEMDYNHHEPQRETVNKTLGEEAEGNSGGRGG